MNIAKNMEAIFLTAAVLLGVSAYASAAAEASAALTPALQVAAVKTPMHVVVIKGQRLSAAEKAKLS